MIHLVIVASENIASQDNIFEYNWFPFLIIILKNISKQAKEPNYPFIKKCNI